MGKSVFEIDDTKRSAFISISMEKRSCNLIQSLKKIHESDNGFGL